jgi:hypothetical protein
VEEVALDAVRVALHVEEAPANVVEDAVGDVDVVGDEIALRQPGLGEEHLVRVRDGDLAAADPHPRKYRENEARYDEARLVAAEASHASAGI